MWNSIRMHIILQRINHDDCSISIWIDNHAKDDIQNFLFVWKLIN